MGLSFFFSQTDTASVLQETIGYIRFLLGQIEVHFLSEKKKNSSILCTLICIFNLLYLMYLVHVYACAPLAILYTFSHAIDTFKVTCLCIYPKDKRKLLRRYNMEVRI